MIIARITTFIATLSFVFLTASPVLAQSNNQINSESVIQDVEGLRLRLVQNTQDPETKQIRFDLTVTSQITSDRVQLKWEAPGAEIVRGEASVNFAVSAGNSYTYSIFIRPRILGVMNVRATVQAFQVDGIKLASATKTIAFSTAGEVFPKAGNHDLAILVNTIRQTSATIFVVLAAIGAALLIAKLFGGWLNNPNV
jgi:hypothetical protein